MLYGLTNKQLAEIQIIIANYLKVHKVILFGSRAIDTYKETSDIDLAIIGDDLPFCLSAKLKAQLEEETNIPVFFDIIDYQTITNSKLKDHINEYGIVIYQRELTKIECQLGQILDIKYGKDHKKLNNGKYPCFGSGGVMRFVDSFLYDKESILIPRKGSLNNVMYQNKPFWTVDTLFWTKINTNVVVIKFLFYQLKLVNYSTLNVGSAVPSLTVPIINEINISLPPLPEQQAIAEVLSSLDDKIDLLHRQNKTLEDMAQTLFRQWFIEEAQDDWEEVKIQDFDVLITDYVANGSFASLKENVKLITDKVSYALFVRNTDIKSGFKNKVYVDKSSYDFLKKTKLYGKEIIISNVGDVGSVFRCPNFDIPMTLGNNLIMLKSNYNLFFYLLFSSKYGQNLIAGITSGSVQQKFNKTAFRNLSLKFESIFQLKRFEDKVSILFDKQDANQTQIQTLENLRDTLLPKLISAEVRVRY